MGKVIFPPKISAVLHESKRSTDSHDLSGIYRTSASSLVADIDHSYHIFVLLLGVAYLISRWANRVLLLWLGGLDVQAPTVAHRTGRLMVMGGLIGLVAVAFLIAALLAPTPSPNSMRRETDFFRWQDAGVILQALTMLPVTFGIYRLGGGRDSSGKYVHLILGLFAQTSLCISSVLIFTGTLSDMFYMGPIGLVGLWLLFVNRRAYSLSPPRIARTGLIAGMGLVIVGIGFLIYAVFVAPAVLVRPLSNAEIDAQSLTSPNLVAHICMAAGTLFGRLIYPIWAILFGRRLMQLRHQVVPGPLGQQNGDG